MWKKIFVVLAALTIALSGCKGGGDSAAKVKSFIGGTDSIDFEFVEGAPPAEVFDKGTFPFDVTVKLENKGEYDVPKEKINVSLKGFFPGDFGSPVTMKSPDEKLDRSYIDSDGNIVPGTVSFLTFPNFNFRESLPANNEFTIRAELCYEYGLTAQTDLCVIDDLTMLKDEVCIVNEKKNVESSSSPIKIENLNENVAGTDKVSFSFDVVSRGSGAISKKGSGCSEKQIDKDKVYLDVDTGLPGLSCSGLSDGNATSGYTTLFGGKRLIRCTQDTSSAALQGKDFQKKINIKGIFDYKEHKQRNIIVKHATS